MKNDKITEKYIRIYIHECLNVNFYLIEIIAINIFYFDLFPMIMKVFKNS